MALFTKDDNITNASFTKYDNVRLSVVRFNDDKTQVLNQVMLRFYNSKIKNKYDVTMEWDNKERELRPELENLVMHHAINNYNNGGQYAVDTITDNGKGRINNIHYYNINDIELKQLSIIVNELLNGFWYRIKQIEIRNQNNDKSSTKNEGLSENLNEVIYIDNEGQIKERDDLDYTSYINSKARTIIFTAFNLGVFNAPKQVIANIESAGYDTFGEDIDYIRFAFAFRWKTKANPDPIICLPLRDKIFPIDAKNIPIPQLDTHPHCRCILILVKKK